MFVAFSLFYIDVYMLELSAEGATVLCNVSNYS